MRITRERRDNLIQWLETRGGPLRGYVVTYGHLQPAIEDCNELEDRLAQAEALLRGLSEYFDNYADVTDSDRGVAEVPNESMEWKSRIDAFLSGGGE